MGGAEGTLRPERVGGAPPQDEEPFRTARRPRRAVGAQPMEEEAEPATINKLGNLLKATLDFTPPISPGIERTFTLLRFA